jgi:hypothetical protein
VHPPTPLSRTRPEADSGLGQNCGGHPRANIATPHRRAHVCLFCSSSGTEHRNFVVFGTYVLLRNEFLVRTFQNGSNKYSNVGFLVTNKFCCSPAYRLSLPPSRVNTR